MKHTPLACLSLLLAACLQISAPALAREFPSQIVRFVIPYPAGGGVDGLARPLAERLGKMWGQSVVIENKPGASTMLGGDTVARATADGHTLFFTSDSSITSNPHLFKKMPFDPIVDLAPVTQVADLHQMVVVHPSVPANSLQELVALAKAKPGQLNYGSYGVGSQPHLLFEMLKKHAGIDIVQVSHRGVAPALVSTIAGDIQMTLGGAASSSAYLESGQLKALAIGRKERLSAYPTLPTLAEAGLSEIDPRSWYGIFAPAGTPRPVINRIQKDIAAILKDPEFNARYVEGMGYTAVGSTPDEFIAFIKADLASKGHMISTTGWEKQ